MPRSSSSFLPLSAAILTVSDTRTRDNDTSGDTIEEHLAGAGHRVADRRICRDDASAIQKQVKHWVDDPGIDVVIVTGGTGLTQRDVTPEAITPLFTKSIPGFGELFRFLSYQDIGTSTIQSRAEAGVAAGTLVFLLPGSTGACRLALERIILPQIDLRQRPCNLAELLPRIRHE
ncbi:MAG: molybdenum cofactor biosynthesis protein B [Acidiferrobacteraceae bacterium]